jgi:uncharacterized membrane-anchored protein YjiN (DUF445 family)
MDRNDVSKDSLRMNNKELELRQSKRLALTFFIGAAALFVLTLFMPVTWWSGLLKAFSEAAMVGALADWFAVVALFRRVPIPIVSRHTAIIPSNKDKIADNLAVFVREKFLDTESIVRLIQKHDPAQKVAEWLLKPDTTERIGGYLVKVGVWMLDFVEDSAIQNFMAKAVRTMVSSVDLSKAAGVILESLTRNGRHQELLDEAITQLAGLLRNEETQGYIAQGIVDWLKDEYAFIERMLPSELIGRKGADIAVRLAAGILTHVSEDREHPLRKRFDAFVAEFVERLKDDPVFEERSEEIKRYILEDEKLNAYLKSLWHELKDWLKHDLESEHSVLRQRVASSATWIGGALAEDPILRKTLNESLEAAARGAAPEFAGYLTKHIADTVKNWDSEEMSRQIELNIGKDLQFIRINGTVVGGMVGVILYALSHVPLLFG